MSLDECIGDIERRNQPKGRTHSMLAFDDFIKPNQWVFRFRGHDRGQTGGAVVVVQMSMDEPTLVAGVSICTPFDKWKPDKGIEYAVARMHSVGPEDRSNPWRFTTVLPRVDVKDGRDVFQDPEHKTVYAFARKCLHRIFLIHSFSAETCAWFVHRFPWLETGQGLNFPHEVTSG